MPKKPPIKAELRREWLRRSEENGESPPQIAERDRYDIRTVRKQIGLAIEEREMRETRMLVLRNAVEKHYDDLRRFAEKMNSEILGITEVSPTPDDDLFESALRQHLPRSPIWGYASKRRQLKTEEEEHRRRLEELIDGKVRSNRRLVAFESSGISVLTGKVAVMLRIEYPEWLKGDSDYTLTGDLRYESHGEGLAVPCFGTVPLGPMNEEIARQQLPDVCKAIKDIEASIKKSPEYLELAKTAGEIRRLDGKLREELAVIRLRRMVPGRCKFCPV